MARRGRHPQALRCVRQRALSPRGLTPDRAVDCGHTPATKKRRAMLLQPARYGQHCYDTGASLHDFSETINAVMQGRRESRRLTVRAWDCARTWRRLFPVRNHEPVSVALLLATCDAGGGARPQPAAAALVIGGVGLLKPAELVALRIGDLLLPTASCRAAAPCSCSSAPRRPFIAEEQFTNICGYVLAEHALSGRYNASQLATRRSHPLVPRAEKLASSAGAGWSSDRTLEHCLQDVVATSIAADLPAAARLRVQTAAARARSLSGRGGRARQPR